MVTREGKMQHLGWQTCNLLAIQSRSGTVLNNQVSEYVQRQVTCPLDRSSAWWRHVPWSYDIIHDYIQWKSWAHWFASNLFHLVLLVQSTWIHHEHIQAQCQQGSRFVHKHWRISTMLQKGSTFGHRHWHISTIFHQGSRCNQSLACQRNVPSRIKI